MIRQSSSKIFAKERRGKKNLQRFEVYSGTSWEILAGI